MKKWTIIGLLCVILIGGLAVWIFLPEKSVLSTKQETQVLKDLLGRDPHLVAQNAPTTWMVRKNAYLQFSYPSLAKIYPAENQAKSNMLDSFSFGILNQHVTATIQTVTFDGVLAEYPAVNLRLTQNSLYTPSATSDASIAFSKDQDMVERSIFFLKNGHVISIAVTGYDDGDVEGIYYSIFASLKIY